MSKEILPDGSVKGETFSGPNYKGEYPSPRAGESNEEYHKRVNEAKEKGFHLGDLSWGDWDLYCRGSGVYHEDDYPTPDEDDD